MVEEATAVVARRRWQVAGAWVEGVMAQVATVAARRWWTGWRWTRGWRGGGVEAGGSGGWHWGRGR